MADLLFNPQELSDARCMTEAFVDRYLAGIADRPVFPDVDREALRELINRPIPKEGETLEALFEELDRVIIPNATHTAHPRFLPYVQPSPDALSPFAETVAAVINQNCNLWHLSPAANAVEKAVLNRFAGMFGFPGTVGGIITSGGSMANLVALTAARDQKLGPAARRQGLQGRTTRLVLYTSDEAHQSIDKAASVLGLGSDYVRHIPKDDMFRISVDMLAEAVAADRASGLEPFCVVGSAGTVTTGAVDPIAELSVFCRREGLWLHIDGAYGALAALSPRFSGRMSAIGRSDSVSLDPHKFLFCSFEAGCVLVRDRATLRHAFSTSPSYLTMSEDPDFLDFANYGPQLSRGFKALKVWWSLKHFWTETYARVIENMADLAAYMGKEVDERGNFELLAPVVFNCVCFRLRCLGADGNLSALETLVDSGAAFLGPALVKGQTGLRACFMNLRTTREDVDFILDQLSRIEDK